MNLHASTSASASDRWVAAALATFSMFVVGYTATRVYLSQPASEAPATESQVVAHPAAMWTELGQ